MRAIALDGLPVVVEPAINTAQGERFERFALGYASISRLWTPDELVSTFGPGYVGRLTAAQAAEGNLYVRTWLNGREVTDDCIMADSTVGLVNRRDGSMEAGTVFIYRARLASTRCRR